MKTGLFIVSTMTVFVVALTACGHDDKQEAEDLQSEGTAKIAANAQTVVDLRSNYSIEISHFESATTTDAKAPWSKLTFTQRQDVEGKLNSLASNDQRILEIGSHKNMMITNPQASQTEMDNAALYLKYAKAYDAKHPGG